MNSSSWRKLTWQPCASKRLLSDNRSCWFVVDVEITSGIFKNIRRFLDEMSTNQIHIIIKFATPVKRKENFLCILIDSLFLGLEQNCCQSHSTMANCLHTSIWKITKSFVSKPSGNLRGLFTSAIDSAIDSVIGNYYLSLPKTAPVRANGDVLSTCETETIQHEQLT